MTGKPEWLRVKHREDPNMEIVERILEKYGLDTICREAACPNSMECFSRKTATFLIMGTDCTRNCGFCKVHSGVPKPPDPGEPEKIAGAVAELGLKYVVVTSVTRDDLDDGGAGHFAETVLAIGRETPKTAVEVLIPDLMGNLDALGTVAESLPDVISHNMETVASLYRRVRPKAEYRRSLEILRNIKVLNPDIRSKTGIMLGLGETRDEVCGLMDDIRSVGVEFLTIGQYLAPSKNHLPVLEYVHPDVFDEYREIADGKGFLFTASAPFVRSSYHAGEALDSADPVPPAPENRS